MFCTGSRETRKGTEIMEKGAMEGSFRQALSDFTFEAASGGAIRHLADLGFTVKQIEERLDFPTPPARIRETVWKHLIDTGVICLEDPRSASSGTSGGPGGVRINYVREYDSYGRPSFRRVAEADSGREAEGEYLVCEFGSLRYKDPQKYSQILSLLDAVQAEYIDGLPWPPGRVWHRTDDRMLEIFRRIRDAGEEQGDSFRTSEDI